MIVVGAGNSGLTNTLSRFSSLHSPRYDLSRLGCDVTVYGLLITLRVPSLTGVAFSVHPRM